MDIIRESALKVGSGRKIPYCTREFNLCQRRAGLMLCQLSYVPTPDRGVILTSSSWFKSVQVVDVSAAAQAQPELSGVRGLLRL